MPSKELISLVAEAIIENPPVEIVTDDEIILDWSPTARAAISTIHAALQEPDASMLGAAEDICVDGPYLGRLVADLVWVTMLAASALGEQSDG